MSVERSLRILVWAVVALFVASPAAHATLAYERDGMVVVAGDDGSLPRPLGPGVWPAVSPDGRLVAFSRRTSSASVELWVADAATGASRRVSERLGSALRAVTWAPDSRRIVAPGRSKLVVLDVRSGHGRVVADLHDAGFWGGELLARGSTGGLCHGVLDP